MGTPVAERVRQHRARKKASRLEAQQRAQSRRSTVQATTLREHYEAAVADPAAHGMTLTALATMAVNVEKAEAEAFKRRLQAGLFADLAETQRLWNEALNEATKLLLGLPDTLAAELATAGDERAVKRLLTVQMRGVVAGLDRSPVVLPAELGLQRKP